MNEYIIFCLAWILTYFFVWIPTWKIIANIKNINIQKIWSWNSWATNTLRALWVKWGILVLVLDILKWFIPLFLIRYFFPENAILQILIPIISILGNLFSPYLKFKWWKWISTSVWIFFAYDPLITIITLTIWIIAIYAIRLVSVITLSIYFSLVIITYFIFPFNNFLWFLVMFILVVLAHRKNIQRILKWEEKKISFSK